MAIHWPILVERIKQFERDYLAADSNVFRWSEDVYPKRFWWQRYFWDFFQCEYSHFSSITKTTSTQHGLKIFFANQNNFLWITKCLPTYVIKTRGKIWRWNKFKGCDFIIIRWGFCVEGRLFLVWFTNECLCC